jgi:hypothetical protein
MRSSRPFCSAAALPDGDAGDDGRKIFVVGVSGSGAEIYDPVADTWEDCGDGYAPTSAPGLGSPGPHLHRDWARPFHICTGTGLPLPHLHRDWARRCRICIPCGHARGHWCAAAQCSIIARIVCAHSHTSLRECTFVLALVRT